MQQKFEVGQIVVLAKHGSNQEAGINWTQHLSRPEIGQAYKVERLYNGKDVIGLGVYIDSSRNDDGYIISNDLLILKTWL